jgi:DNA-directed RNA polymerase subunit F
MIISNEPLSLAEVLDYMKNEETESEIVGFIKKFNKLHINEAKELRREVENLGIIKITTEHAVKIVDLLPETAEELNRIFVDVSLDENETQKLLETIKKFR